MVDWSSPQNYYTLKCELEDGLSYREIADKYGESQSCIRGGARRHGLKSDATRPRGPGRQFTAKELVTLKELVVFGCRTQKCAEAMGIPLSTFQRMVEKHTELIEAAKALREHKIKQIAIK